MRTRQTKRGDRIGIFTLDDGTAQMEVVCFSECFQTYRPLITEDQMVIAEGDVGLDEFNNRPRILCRELFTIDQGENVLPKPYKLIYRLYSILILIRLNCF